MISSCLLQNVLYFNVSPFNPTLSDCHCKLSWKLLCHYTYDAAPKSKVSKMNKKIKWNKDSVSSFQKTLLQNDFQEKISIFNTSDETDLNILSEKLNDIFLDAAKQCLKSSNINSKKSPKKRPKHKKWFDNELYIMKRNLLSYSTIYSKCPNDPYVHGHFYKLLRQYNRSRKLKKRQFREGILNQIENLESNNPKEYWELVKKLKDAEYNNPAENISAEIWSEHFKKLNQLEHTFTPREQIINDLVVNMEHDLNKSELDHPVTVSEVTRAISKLKNNKSCGLDLITNEMLKASIHIMSTCFQKIFNICLQSGKYPKLWAVGYTLPLFKSGDPCDPGNYRGISITSAIGKVFNSILDNRLDKFLVEKQLISKFQIGFVKKTRTSDHMFIMKTLIDSVFAKGKKLFACFIDFKKAYDKVIHSGIKYKMLQLGIGGQFYKIVKDMYLNSETSIRVNQYLTSSFNIELGVRQGDNLSPNLFKIFVNDLPNYFTERSDDIELDGTPIHCLMYADDLVLFSSTASGLQSKLSEVDTYCQDWCLQVNTNKSKILIFNKAGRLLKEKFILGKNELECVKTYKYLGLSFSASGIFSQARDELYKKSLKGYFKLCKDILCLHPRKPACTYLTT